MIRRQVLLPNKPSDYRAMIRRQVLLPNKPSPERLEYHANGTYWSCVPTVDWPCDFCNQSIVDHDPRTHACRPVYQTRG
jgi:hypothetical protein